MSKLFEGNIVSGMGAWLTGSNSFGLISLLISYNYHTTDPLSRRFVATGPRAELFQMRPVCFSAFFIINTIKQFR